MFKIISKNTSIVKNCKTQCELYNHSINSCVFKDLNYDDPNTLKRCLNFLPINDTSFLYTEKNKPNTIETDYDFVFEIIGKRNVEDVSNLYPLEPEMDFSETIPNIYWYVEPNKTYGCWILKHKNKPFAAIPNSKEQAERGWVKSIYRSPIPLHDHAASKSLESRMCWFVDEDGWGQYTLILANQIKFITYPKPLNFKK